MHKGLLTELPTREILRKKEIFIYMTKDLRISSSYNLFDLFFHLHIQKALRFYECRNGYPKRIKVIETYEKMCIVYGFPIR